MIYVASPYSHPDEEVRQARYEAVREWTFDRIIHKNQSLFSPIIYCHEYALENELPKDADFWYKFNLGFMQNCNLIYVLMLDGWEKSLGVTAEIKLAHALDKPVKYFPYTHPLISAFS